MSYYIDYETGQPVLCETHVMDNLSDPVYIGLAVTSSDAGSSTIGTFSEVKITPIPFLHNGLSRKFNTREGHRLPGLKSSWMGLQMQRHQPQLSNPFLQQA